MLCRLYIDFV